MADYFKEQIIKTSMDPKIRILKVAISIVLCLGILTFVKIPVVSLIIIALIFYADNRFTRFFAPGVLERELELEYIATNGSFEIDMVINKSSRRHEFDIEMKDISFFSKVDNQKLLGQAHGAEVKDFSNLKNTNKDDKYTFIAMYKGKKIQVIFEPNEDIVEIFKNFVPKHAIEL